MDKFYINSVKNSKLSRAIRLLLLILFVCLCPSVTFGQLTTVTFNASGSFNVPVGVTSITVECWGAGGGGGGSTGGTSGGGGGGGGGYSTATIVVVSGGTIAYTVGAGGAGGINANGVNGGTTTFSTVNAPGGARGLRGNNAYGAGGAGGVGANYTGGAGSIAGIVSGTYGGGGGASSGSGSNGNPAVAAVGGFAVAGGSAGGNGAFVVFGFPVAAQAGTAPGSGGGGGRNGNNGAAGGVGQIRLTYCLLVGPVIARNPPAATVCAGTMLTRTLTSAGTGGTGVSQDEYRYNNGSGLTAWSTTVPNFVAVLGTNTIESRRTSTGSGCNTATGNTLSWTVVAPPSTPIVGAITHPTCSTTGSVVLSGLPFPGTINQTGTVINSFATTGVSMTVSGLVAGSYFFAANNGICSSASTAAVVINPVVTNTWTGVWSNGVPTSSQALVFAANYASSGNIAGCSCTVNTTRAVTINSGHTMTITAGVTVNGTGSLTFEDTASLVQTNNVANTGNVIYKRTPASFDDSDYTYWSSPVANQNLLLISPLTRTDRFYTYDSTADDWAAVVPASTTMVTGKGYISTGQGMALPAFFIGVPNNGNLSISSGTAGNSNLIGNPYPSALYADQFLFDNSAVLEGTIYFWTHNTGTQLPSDIILAGGTPGAGVLAYTSDDYASYNLTGGVGSGTGTAAISGGGIPTGRIAAGQGFFITSLGGMVSFTNSMRVAGNNNQFFRTKNPSSKKTSSNEIERNRVWLNLTNTQGAFKQTLVGYITEATNEFDTRFDGKSLDGNDFIDFYSVCQDKNLTIQGRALPFDENDVVPLGYSSKIEGDFTISIYKTDGLFTNQSVYIEDKLTQTTVNLKKGNYTFNTGVGTFNDRFVLRYASEEKVAIEDSKESSVLLSTLNEQITVNSSNQEISKIMIYDLLGRLIYEKEAINSDEYVATDFSPKNQTLLVKVVLKNGEIATPKIIY